MRKPLHTHPAGNAQDLAGLCLQAAGDYWLVLDTDSGEGGVELTVRNLDGAIERRALPDALPGLDGASRLEPARFFRPVADCPLCGAAAGESRRRFRVRQLFWEVDGLICGRCGLVYKSPAPREDLLAFIYRADYVHFRGDLITGQGPSDRIRRLGRPRGRHLDFGCGSGQGVLDALDAGWDSYGCDPYLPQIPAGHPLHQRLFRHDVTEPGAAEVLGEFDCISMWAVVEHLPQPLQVLQSLVRLLRPAGRLVFNSPNGASLIARLEGSRWYMASLIEHLLLMTPKSVRWVADHFDLELLRLRYAGVPYPLGKKGAGLSGQGLDELPFAAVDVAAEAPPRPPATAAGSAGGPWRLTAVAQRRDGGGRWGQLLRLLLHLTRLGDHVEAVLVKPGRG